MTTPNPAVEKFVKTSIWDFKRALEVALSELGIEIAVQGVYSLDSAFMILVKDEQEKAKKYLEKQGK